MKELLKLEGVSLLYHSNTMNGKSGLCKTDLTIYEGDRIIIWGPNGSGKTSLLNVIGIGKNTSGKVFLCGKDITDMPEYKRSDFIAVVSQHPEDMICETFSLMENFAVAVKRGARRGFHSAINRHVEEIFKNKLSKLKMGLECRLDNKLKEFSGGEFHSAVVLMPFLGKPPKLILLDEVTASLDLEKTVVIESLISSLIQEYNITALLVTHNPEQAVRSGNRILFMSNGEIVSDIRIDEKIPGLSLLQALKDFHSQGTLALRHLTMK
jgi:putative ABC transport system ATP-binding protein